MASGGKFAVLRWFYLLCEVFFLVCAVYELLFGDPGVFIGSLGMALAAGAHAEICLLNQRNDERRG